MSKPKKGRVEKHNKWGYIFLIPFILTYVIFQLIPLISTIYNSFFENYSMGLIQVGPNYIGLENYASLAGLISIGKNQEVIDLFEKHNDNVGVGICTTDLIITSAWCMVLRHTIKIESIRFFQNRYLFTKLDHGVSVCNVILRIVL